MNELQLEEFEDSIVDDVKEVIEYPCLLIEDVKESSLDSLTLVQVKDKEKALPLYVQIDQEIRKIGECEVDLSSFLALRFLNKDMIVKLLVDANNGQDLVLKDPKSFLMLMGMGGANGS